MCVCGTDNVTQTILVLMEYVSSPSLENVVYGKLQIGFTGKLSFCWTKESSRKKWTCINHRVTMT